MSSDDAIRATNDDAASCKRFAVQQGYWNDPYIKHFVRSGERKAPEINRGYFARVSAVQTLLKNFIKLTDGQCQVIDLGAGFDTTQWTLKDAGLQPQNFVEIDFPSVTARKCFYIKQRKPLLENISSSGDDIDISSNELHASRYHIIAADLRNLSEVEAKLGECKIDASVPTVIFAECVLVYMESKHSSALLKWLADYFSSVFFINYEQVNMDDRFGQVMVENLRARLCELHGIQHCRSLETQKQRFILAGWEGAQVLDMNMAYHQLPSNDRERIERLEFLDERELLDQLLQHYSIGWAYKDTSQIGLQSLDLT